MGQLVLEVDLIVHLFSRCMLIELDLLPIVVNSVVSANCGHYAILSLAPFHDALEKVEISVQSLFL